MRDIDTELFKINKKVKHFKKQVLIYQQYSATLFSLMDSFSLVIFNTVRWDMTLKFYMESHSIPINLVFSPLYDHQLQWKDIWRGQELSLKLMEVMRERIQSYQSHLGFFPTSMQLIFPRYLNSPVTLKFSKYKTLLKQLHNSTWFSSIAIKQASTSPTQALELEF